MRQALAAGDATSARANYLAYRRALIGAEWLELLTNRFYEETTAEDSVALADAIVAGRIPVRGIIPASYREDPLYIDFGETIDWVYNPVPSESAEYTSEFEYYINRMPFWRTLSDAYRQTQDPRYTQAWVDQMQGWLTQGAASGPEAEAVTPLMWRSLEAAIRMDDTWPYAYVSFLNAEDFTPEAHMAFVQSAMEHADYLSGVLKAGPGRTGNWVANESLALLTLAVLFPEWKDAPDYRAQAVARLEAEMTRQVNEDGSQKELSPWYHDVTLTRFRRALDLLRLSGTAPSESFEQGLRNMYGYELAMMDQSGQVPMFNDGLPLNVRGALASAQNLWDDPAMTYAVTDGEHGHEPALCSWLPDAGYAVFRNGWGPDDFTLWFDAGPPGIEHFHQDRLGLVLSVAGRELLTEAGHCIYDSSTWRSYALGTAAHSTILVDGKQQHASGTQVEVENRWRATPEFVLCEGVYDSGYQEAVYTPKSYWPIDYVGELDKSIQHRRTVLYLEPELFVVWDRLLGIGNHAYEALFHFDGTVEVDELNLSVSVTDDDGYGIFLYPLQSDDVELSTVTGQTEPVLGWKTFKRHPLTTAIYSKQENAPASFVNLIMPIADGSPQLDVTAAEPGIWELRTGANAWWLMLSPDAETPREWSLAGLPELRITSMLAVESRHADDSRWVGADAISGFTLGLSSYTLAGANTVYFVRTESEDSIQYQLHNAAGGQTLVLTSQEDGSHQSVEPGAFITFNFNSQSDVF